MDGQMDRWLGEGNEYRREDREKGHLTHFLRMECVPWPPNISKYLNPYNPASNFARSWKSLVWYNLSQFIQSFFLVIEKLVCFNLYFCCCHMKECQPTSSQKHSLVSCFYTSHILPSAKILTYLSNSNFLLPRHQKVDTLERYRVGRALQNR